MVDRANMLHYLTVTAQGLQANLGITALALLPAPDADAGLTVDEMARRLNVPLTPTERTDCTAYLDTSRDNAGNVTSDPFDPIGAPAVAEERLRGLLWILAQHPNYQVR
jgi:hypothetical protein